MQWRPHTPEADIRRALSKGEVIGYQYVAGDRAGTVLMHGAPAMTFFVIEKGGDTWKVIAEIMVPSPRTVEVLYVARNYSELHRQLEQDGKALMFQTLQSWMDEKDEANGHITAKRKAEGQAAVISAAADSVVVDRQNEAHRAETARAG